VNLLNEIRKSSRGNFSISSDANHGAFFLKSYFLTLFLIGCLLTLQFPLNFSKPQRGPVPRITLLLSKGLTQTRNDRACRAVTQGLDCLEHYLTPSSKIPAKKLHKL
jgi:hypothetical protein